MELKQMMKILVRWWWLAILPVIVVVAYVGLTFTQPETVYQIVMHFAAGGEPSTHLSADYDRYYAWLSSEYIANALADVTLRGTFAEAVAVRLADQGLDIHPGTIQNAIASDNAQSILVVYVTWSDSTHIVAVAEAISAELTQNGAAYFPQLKTIGTVARRIDPLNPIALPPSLRAQLLGPGLKVALAAAAGLALVTLAHYFDPTVRERKELAQLGVTILASIPKR